MTDLTAFSLERRTVMVTGANTGIGQGIAVSAAKAGAKVLGVGRSDLSETARLIGDAFVPVSCDLADLDAAREMLETAWREHGPIDGLVNNAGIIRRADATDYTEGDWDAVMDTNLKTVFFLSQSYAKLTLGAGRTGKIVNIASLLSFQGGIRVAAYTASKHGVAGVTQILANEWAARGINVNAIAPGWFVTDINRAFLESEKGEAMKRTIPMGRFGNEGDLDGALLLLASKAGAYITGATIVADGGEVVVLN